ncbi:uncharacterized protein [Diabrotica undecimpunctata]|uniref:uncharacterized protein n=1 Tax=Diabrotica undecimpunctata TaxID=50387 RepID=UPI003B63477D
MACLLFNIALEKAVRNTEIKEGGGIYNRLIQTLAYADDIDIIGYSKRDIEQYFLELKTAVKQIGLVINDDKNKYMLVTKNPIATEERKTVFVNHIFDHFDSFTYLGSLMTITNKTSKEIKR